MTITQAQRDLMAHSALDPFETQEIKRVWWSLYNLSRTFDWLNVAELMADLEAMIAAMKDAHLV